MVTTDTDQEITGKKTFKSDLFVGSVDEDVYTKINKASILINQESDENAFGMNLGSPGYDINEIYSSKDLELNVLTGKAFGSCTTAPNQSEAGKFIVTDKNTDKLPESLVPDNMVTVDGDQVITGTKMFEKPITIETDKYGKKNIAHMNYDMFELSCKDEDGNNDGFLALYKGINGYDSDELYSDNEYFRIYVEKEKVYGTGTTAGDNKQKASKIVILDPATDKVPVSLLPEASRKVINSNNYSLILDSSLPTQIKSENDGLNSTFKNLDDLIDYCKTIDLNKNGLSINIKQGDYTWKGNSKYINYYGLSLHVFEGLNCNAIGFSGFSNNVIFPSIHGIFSGCEYVDLFHLRMENIYGERNVYYKIGEISLGTLSCNQSYFEMFYGIYFDFEIYNGGNGIIINGGTVSISEQSIIYFSGNVYNDKTLLYVYNFGKFLNNSSYAKYYKNIINEMTVYANIQKVYATYGTIIDNFNINIEGEKASELYGIHKQGYGNKFLNDKGYYTNPKSPFYFPDFGLEIINDILNHKLWTNEVYIYENKFITTLSANDTHYLYIIDLDLKTTDVIDISFCYYITVAGIYNNKLYCGYYEDTHNYNNSTILVVDLATKNLESISLPEGVEVCHGYPKMYNGKFYIIKDDIKLLEVDLDTEIIYEHDISYYMNNSFTFGDGILYIQGKNWDAPFENHIIKFDTNFQTFSVFDLSFDSDLNNISRKLLYYNDKLYFCGSEHLFKLDLATNEIDKFDFTNILIDNYYLDGWYNSIYANKLCMTTYKGGENIGGFIIFNMDTNTVERINTDENNFWDCVIHSSGIYIVEDNRGLLVAGHGNKFLADDGSYKFLDIPFVRKTINIATNSSYYLFLDASNPTAIMPGDDDGSTFQNFEDLIDYCKTIDLNGSKLVIYAHEGDYTDVEKYISGGDRLDLVHFSGINSSCIVFWGVHQDYVIFPPIEGAINGCNYISFNNLTLDHIFTWQIGLNVGLVELNNVNLRWAGVDKGGMMDIYNCSFDVTNTDFLIYVYGGFLSLRNNYLIGTAYNNQMIRLIYVNNHSKVSGSWDNKISFYNNAIYAPGAKIQKLTSEFGDIVNKIEINFGSFAEEPSIIGGITNSGDGTKFLSDDGNYKKVIESEDGYWIPNTNWVNNHVNCRWFIRGDLVHIIGTIYSSASTSTPLLTSLPEPIIANSFGIAVRNYEVFPVLMLTTGDVIIKCASIQPGDCFDISCTYISSE